MQYLILTSRSNFLHNVSKNVTDTIFNAFVNSQIMCENWLIFTPVWFYEWGSKNYFQKHKKIAVHCSQNTTTSEIQMSVWPPSHTIPPATTNIQIAALISQLLISVKQLIWL